MFGRRKYRLDLEVMLISNNSKLRYVGTIWNHPLDTSRTCFTESMSVKVATMRANDGLSSGFIFQHSVMILYLSWNYQKYTEREILFLSRKCKIHNIGGIFKCWTTMRKLQYALAWYHDGNVMGMYPNWWKKMPSMR